MDKEILQQRPNSEKANKLIKDMLSADAKLTQSIEILEQQKKEVVDATHKMTEAEVEKTLAGIDIEELNRDKQGIRVANFKKAGYKNFLIIYRTNARIIASKKGIGEETAKKAKKVVEKVASEIRKNAVPKLTIDAKNPESEKLVKSLYAYQCNLPLLNDGYNLYDEHHEEILQKAKDAKIVGNGFLWLFSSKKKKIQAVNAYLYLQNVNNEGYRSKVNRIATDTKKTNTVYKNTAWKDFENNSAKYFAALETVDGVKVKDDKSKNGLPSELVAEIEALTPDFTGLKCSLRRYQEFGVKYILNQKCALLGDEMGLGKTVQAIASLVVLRNEGEAHFMVVCPASVLVNWCREIELHSDLKALKIHGDKRDEQFEEWNKGGSVGVTTYETISKFKLEDVKKISALVVDEAHYVKNPTANRTIALMELRKKTERVLFMTGTALENNVDEMCYLISCLNPTVANVVAHMKHLSAAPLFREKLAPVYFRRTRSDVLKELPDLIENQEWCEMGREEKADYYYSTMSRSFMAMRQVSWMVDDIEKSSKAQRLKEICERAKEDGRKVIVFSFFINTIEKIRKLLGDNCFGPINGSVPPSKRQEIIDKFSKAEAGSVLAAQIQAGGTGLNIQCASVVVLCEPQIKPSIENQAISRAYRMGQVRNVMVYRLLCEECVDERIMEILKNKQTLFDNFADKSIVGEESMQITEHAVNNIIEEEIKRVSAQAAE